MKKTILILIPFFLINFCFSQKGYVEGYILKGNDTIKGKIRDKSAFTDATKRIRFMGADKKKQKLSCKEIRGYGKLGLIHYRSIFAGAFKGGQRFAMIMEDGALSLYVFTKKNTHYSQGTMYTGGGNFNHANYGNNFTTTQSTRMFIAKKNDMSTTERVPYLNFKSFMAKYVEDDAEVKKMVENKELSYSDTQLIVRKYNQDKSKK